MCRGLTPEQLQALGGKELSEGREEQCTVCCCGMEAGAGHHEKAVECAGDGHHEHRSGQFDLEDTQHHVPEGLICKTRQK